MDLPASEAVEGGDTRQSLRNAVPAPAEHPLFQPNNDDDRSLVIRPNNEHDTSSSSMNNKSNDNGNNNNNNSAAERGDNMPRRVASPPAAQAPVAFPTVRSWAQQELRNNASNHASSNNNGEANVALSNSFLDLAAAMQAQGRRRLMARQPRRRPRVHVPPPVPQGPEPNERQDVVVDHDLAEGLNIAAAVVEVDTDMILFSQLEASLNSVRRYLEERRAEELRRGHDAERRRQQQQQRNLELMEILNNSQQQQDALYTAADDQTTNPFHPPRFQVAAVVNEPDERNPPSPLCSSVEAMFGVTRTLEGGPVPASNPPSTTVFGEGFTTNLTFSGDGIPPPPFQYYEEQRRQHQQENMDESADWTNE